MKGTTDGSGYFVFENVGSDGTITTDAPQAATYSVATDGTLTITVGAEIFIGGISTSGDFAVAAGETVGAAGSRPSMFFMIR